MAIILQSCANDFLDIKPNKSLVVPQTIEDLQALLDNRGIMNNNTPYMPEVSTNDFYVLDNAYRTQDAMSQNAYKWAIDIYEGSNDALDWNYQYQVVYYANLILETLKTIEETPVTKSKIDMIKGSALFFRSKAFYLLAQQYCKDYNKITSNTDLGISLRLESDLNIKSTRATVEETYQQILKDLQEANTLLPTSVLVKTRPSQSAGLALLAKVYLQMENYNEAIKYVDEVFKGRDLTNYNQVDSSLDYPFERFNNEVIFHATMQFSWFFHETNLIVDSSLLKLYDENDLRKSLYFINNKDVTTYRGSYDGSRNLFSGLALDELYFIKSECLARQNFVNEAMETLNAFLSKRYNENFIPLNAMSVADAVQKIMMEKRKSLVYRGVRWSDIRRINKYSEESITMKRTIENVDYELPPEDLRYVFPISDITIKSTGMTQNSRQ